jgi:methylene-tetrahydromethanopterin dehydrogenase
MTTNLGVLAREPIEPGDEFKVHTGKRSRSLCVSRKRGRATPVLYMLSPQKYMSPFDINMAIDSGYKVIMPYDNVALADVNTLVQDAIFSRPPQNCPRTGFFIGGKDINLALEMMVAARKAMVPPFEVSVFADPGGSFTTAAAQVACVERVLHRSYQRGFKNLRLAVFGATGVVGFASSVLAALEGAQVRVVAHRSVETLVKLAAVAEERFGVRVEPVAGLTEAAKTKIIRESDVIFTAGPAGVRIVSRRQIARAPNLLVAADVNAVGPSGIEGMEAQMDGVPLPGSSALGIGPLVIGDVKYKTQSGLFKRMLTTDKPIHLDFRDAFELARKLTGEPTKAGRPRLA